MAMVLKVVVVVTGNQTILAVMDQPMIMEIKLQLVVVVQVVDMVMVVVAVKFQVMLHQLEIFMEVRQPLLEEIMVAMPLGRAGEVEEEIMVGTVGEAEEEIMVVVTPTETVEEAEDKEGMIIMGLKRGQATLTLEGAMEERM